MPGLIEVWGYGKELDAFCLPDEIVEQVKSDIIEGKFNSVNEFRRWVDGYIANNSSNIENIYSEILLSDADFTLKISDINETKNITYKEIKKAHKNIKSVASKKNGKYLTTNGYRHIPKINIIYRSVGIRGIIFYGELDTNIQISPEQFTFIKTVFDGIDVITDIYHNGSLLILSPGDNIDFKEEDYDIIDKNGDSLCDFLLDQGCDYEE